MPQWSPTISVRAALESGMARSLTKTLWHRSLTKALWSCACAGLLLAALAQCSQRVTIDGRRFAVPPKYRLLSSIPWLPASQRDGLMFIINPDAATPEQILVLLQPDDIACAGTNSSPAEDSFCGPPADNRRFNGLDRPHAAKFIPAPSGDVVSRYVRTDDPSVYLAICSDPGGPQQKLGGLCSTVAQYGDLHYTLAFRGAMVPQLGAIVGRTNRLLSEWEQK